MTLNYILLLHVLLEIQICFTTYKFIKNAWLSQGPAPLGAVGRQVQSAPGYIVIVGIIILCEVAMGYTWAFAEIFVGGGGTPYGEKSSE